MHCVTNYVTETLFSQWMKGKAKQSCCCSCSLISCDAALALVYSSFLTNTSRLICRKILTDLLTTDYCPWKHPKICSSSHETKHPLHFVLIFISTWCECMLDTREVGEVEWGMKWGWKVVVLEANCPEWTNEQHRSNWLTSPTGWRAGRPKLNQSCRTTSE